MRQLRHSALTHAAEDGANTSTLLSYSGHTSVASLARYARVPPEALARWQAGRDPARGPPPLSPLPLSAVSRRSPCSSSCRRFLTSQMNATANPAKARALPTPPIQSGTEPQSIREVAKSELLPTAPKVTPGW